MTENDFARLPGVLQRKDPDGSINLVEYGRMLERPPKSWCYVEAL